MTTAARPPTDGQTPQPPVKSGPSAQERFSWMARNSRILLIALGVLVVGILLATFSFALFTSSSANPGNVVTTGSMEQDNSKDGAAILTAQLLPGENEQGTVSITNVGDADGDFTLTAENLTDTPPTPPLSGELELTVVDETTATTEYDGPLADFTTADLGTWAAGSTHDFTFTVTFTDAGVQDEFQGAQTELDFVWNATQS